MEQQLNIFQELYPTFKITKPIRLIELFAGYGSQNLALKYLNANYSHYKISEWAVKSIKAYKDLHIKDDTDYSANLTDDEVLDFLINKGVSIDYNTPATKQQLKKLDFRNIFNNIKASNNLVNICNIKAKDLEIVNKDIYIYICSYSFPCQDLSNAGLKKGMSDTSTRSGLLWEVERILKECKETDSLPQVLLMENVPQVHQTSNLKDFNKWLLSLESLGYKNYFQDLNAKNYGIPQNRVRTFMVSILGNYNYDFPINFELRKHLKDLMERNVSEKYFLSQKQLDTIVNWNAYEKPLEKLKRTNTFNISPTLTTRTGDYDAGMILIYDNTKKGYKEAKDGDGIDISSRMQSHRGTVQKGLAQTLLTTNSVGVVDKTNIRRLTPKESFRLQGLKDEDCDILINTQTEPSCYHLAGDSICVSVLVSIFAKLLGISDNEIKNIIYSLYI